MLTDTKTCYFNPRHKPITTISYNLIQFGRCMAENGNVFWNTGIQLRITAFFERWSHKEELEIRSESLDAQQFNSAEKQNFYHVVLQTSCTDANTTSFSLYRPPNVHEGEQTFTKSTVCRLSIFVSLVSVNALQKLCDILRENSLWSPSHLIADFSLVDQISTSKLAVKMGNVCKITHLDNNNNLLYHYAALTKKDTINRLSARNALHLNHFNADGCTLLHLVTLADKEDCVKALLAAGADLIFNTKDIS
uniref:ANK_REP_REGION domain-containing protein n=1 Tax=Glossina austeni TaxID=7395 RepID=A0A1A9VR43_GLOAU